LEIRTVSNAELTENQVKEVKDLYYMCNKHDETHYVYDADDEFKEPGDVNTHLLYRGKDLISVVSIFAPSAAEAEIVCLTRPNARRQGHMKTLLSQVEREVRRRKIPSLLYVCDRSSDSSVGFIKKQGGDYEYSEFSLRHSQTLQKGEGNWGDLSLSLAERPDLEKLSLINSKAFGSSFMDARKILNEGFESEKRNLYNIKYQNTIIGMIGVYDETDRNYIYGFAVAPAYQRKGVGRFALQSIVNLCLNENKAKEIDLEVLVKNGRALRLYKTVGFRIITEFGYYRKGL